MLSRICIALKATGSEVSFRCLMYCNSLCEVVFMKTQSRLHPIKNQYWVLLLRFVMACLGFTVGNPQVLHIQMHFFAICLLFIQKPLKLGHSVGQLKILCHLTEKYYRVSSQGPNTTAGTGKTKVQVSKSNTQSAQSARSAVCMVYVST